MNRIFAGTTKNGCDVYVDTESSHAATHLADTPELFELVKETLPHSEPTGDYCVLEEDMGRVVGTSDRVETEEGDEVVYAMRPNRDNYTRFVKNKQPEPTRFVTFHFKKNGEQEYELFSAYVGPIAPPFPGSIHENGESRPFWEKHALVWGRQEVIPGTETSVCPW